jgi:mRNA-degrading endonuclease YafQ of YafQ-DinJ toxin-antitoxin module
MFILSFKEKFLRKAKKLTKNNSILKKAVIKTIRLLEQDPRSPILKTHKVKDINSKTAFSSKVTGDIRIIWNYQDDKANILDILDIGGHEGNNKVYK